MHTPATLPRPLPGFEHINRYWDPVHHTYAAKLLPGEYYVTTEDEMIVTVLGSCVSACIRDPLRGIGGMNHFMLPVHQGVDYGWQPGDLSAAARYGNHAMELLINAILKQGGNRMRLEVKIVGGGQMFAHMTDIGRHNIAFVHAYLRTEGLQMSAEDVGDIYPRKVYYRPSSGKVRMHKLRALHNDTILSRERAYMRSLARRPVRGEVELF